MTDISQAVTVTPADLSRWFIMQDQLRDLKAAESLLRNRIYAHYFPKALAGEPGTEGSNAHDLDDGTSAVLKATRKVERKVDEGGLDAYKAASKEEGSNLPKLPWNKLIRYKPELVTAEYRKLTAEEQLACDQVLIIKDGSPALEIVIPKKRGS